MTKVTTTGANGGRRLSPEHRAKLSDRAKARYAALTPEQQAAQLASLGRKPRGAAPPGPPTPPASGGPSNPLSHAPGDSAAGAPAGPAPTAPGLNGHAGPARSSYAPSFEIPDTAPRGPSGPEGEPQGPPLVGPDGGVPFAVSEGEIRDLLALPFQFVALRRGDHWKLSDDELGILAPAITRKINEHQVTARAIQAGGDYLVISAGLGLLISTRLMEDRERADRARAAGARPVNDGPGPRGVPTAGDNGYGGRRAGPDAGRPGHLNGYPTGGDRPAGPLDDAGPPPVAPAAPGSPLVQPL